MSQTFSDGTSKQNQRAAEKWAVEQVNAIEARTFVAPSERTLKEFLEPWLSTIEPPARRPATYRLYAHAVRKHLIPALGHYRLLDLDLMHVETFYATLKKAAKPATVRLVHVVLSMALKKAVKAKYVRANVALDARDVLPKVERTADDVQANCWTQRDAAKFLMHTKTFGSAQEHASFSLLLDAGMRVGEALGLKWGDFDERRRRLTVQRQLLSPAESKGDVIVAPVYGPPKRGGARHMKLRPETVDALIAHRREQRETMLANRKVWYQADEPEEGRSMFAKGVADLGCGNDTLGLPLSRATVASALKRLSKGAGVRLLKGPHGLRHSCATHRLERREPVHHIARQLGHSTEMLTKVYAHVLDDEQDDVEELAETSR